jgi:hypothetical protein
MPSLGAVAEEAARNKQPGGGVGSVEPPTSTGGILPQAGGCRASRFARKGVTRLDTNAKRIHDRDEAAFKKKEERLREGQQAMAEYEAARLATNEKTARLRALRLARDAAPSPYAQPRRMSRIG